jgi:hypothetical protein
MLTIPFLKAPPTNSGVGLAGNFGPLFFLKRTSHLGLDTKYLFIRFFGYAFEPGSSNFQTLWFEF